MKKSVVLVILFIAVFVALLVYSTMGNRRFRCQVCMTFQGRSSCRIAAASSKEQALRTATENACALISSGVTDSIACGNTRPDSVQWLSGN